MTARWYRDAPPNGGPSIEMDEADLPAWEAHIADLDRLGIPGIWPWPIDTIPLEVVRADGTVEPYVPPA